MNDTNTILFGADSTPGIVAVEAGESEAVLYIRSGNSVSEIREPFAPWMLLNSKEGLESEECTELEGEGFRYLVKYPSWSAFNSAKSSVRASGKEQYSYASPEKQFLMSSGKTLFKNMAFNDIHRMQVDIETAGLSFEPASNRILMIAVSDNQGFEDILDGTEEAMLKRLIEVMRE
ncbi:MAG TPA: hypothetical protein VGK34_03745, partial [Armatimonadota bacterium]